MAKVRCVTSRPPLASIGSGFVAGKLISIHSHLNSISIPACTHNKHPLTCAVVLKNNIVDMLYLRLPSIVRMRRQSSGDPTWRNEKSEFKQIEHLIGRANRGSSDRSAEN